MSISGTKKPVASRRPSLFPKYSRRRRALATPPFFRASAPRIAQGAPARENTAERSMTSNPGRRRSSSATGRPVREITARTDAEPQARRESVRRLSTAGIRISSPARTGRSAGALAPRGAPTQSPVAAEGRIAMTGKRTGGEILADQIAAFGGETLFTVPGESFLGLLDGLHRHRDTIRVVTCRHEGGAANMAEA